MAVATEHIYTGPYTGLGIEQDFVVTFQSAGADEIEVWLDGVLVPSGDWVFARDDDGRGIVTATLDGEVYILSAPNFQQEVDFQRHGPNFFDSMNDPLDRAVQRDQWLKAKVDALLPANGLLPGEGAGMFIGRDADSAPVFLSGTGADSALRTDLVASAGAALIGWISAGVGALLRSIANIFAERCSVMDFIPSALHASMRAGTNTTPLTAYIQAAIDYAVSNGHELIFPRAFYLVNGQLKVGPSIISDWSVMLARTDQGVYATMYDPYYSAAQAILNRDNLFAISLRGQNAVIVADFAPASPTPVIEYNIPHIHGVKEVTGITVTTPSRIVAEHYLGHHNLDDPQTTNKLIGFASAVATLRRVEMQFGNLQCGLLGWGMFHSRIDVRTDNCGDAVNMAVANAVEVNLVAWYGNRGLVLDGDSGVLNVHTEQVATDVRIFANKTGTLHNCYLEDAVTATDGTGNFCLDLGATAGVERVSGLTVIGAELISARPNKKALRLHGANNGVTFIGCIEDCAGSGMTIDAVGVGALVNCGGSFNDLFNRKRFSRVNGIYGVQPLKSDESAYTFLGEYNFLLAAHSYGTIAAGGNATNLYALPDTIPITFLYGTAQFNLASGGNDLIDAKMIGLSTTQINVQCVNPTSAGLAHNTAVYRVVVRLYGDAFV